MSQLRSVLIWLALVFAAGVACAAPPAPSTWQHDIAQLTAEDSTRPPPQHAVLFVGSSSIRFWKPTLVRDFSGIPVIDRGFGGSTIADSTYYADRIIIPYHPRVIVMYAGDNDIAEGLTPAQVADNFRAFVARVRKALPDVAIVYISIKPSLARWQLWPQMHAANRAIERWAHTQRRVVFVDTAKDMLGADGKPRAQLFREDGLHMLPAGYAIWVAALRPVLARFGFGTQHGAPARQRR